MLNNKKEYVYKTKTVIERDTVTVVDTVTKYVSIPVDKLVPYKVTEYKYIDSTKRFDCDSLRDYSLTAIDNDSLKVVANLQTRGVLTKADFDIQLYHPTRTVTERVTVTNYVERDGVYVTGFVSTASDVYVGAIYTKNSWLYGASYSPSSGQVLFGIGYRVY